MAEALRVLLGVLEEILAPSDAGKLVVVRSGRGWYR